LPAPNDTPTPFPAADTEPANFIDESLAAPTVEMARIFYDEVAPRRYLAPRYFVFLQNLPIWRLCKRKCRLQNQDCGWTPKVATDSHEPRQLIPCVAVLAVFPKPKNLAQCGVSAKRHQVENHDQKIGLNVAVGQKQGVDHDGECKADGEKYWRKKPTQPFQACTPDGRAAGMLSCHTTRGGRRRKPQYRSNAIRQIAEERVNHPDLSTRRG